jgi:hypothetical protein
MVGENKSFKLVNTVWSFYIKSIDVNCVKIESVYKYTNKGGTARLRPLDGVSFYFKGEKYEDL